MAVRKINESTLTDIADAIRSKTGGSALINPENMASEIESIQTGGVDTLGLALSGELTHYENSDVVTIRQPYALAVSTLQSCFFPNLKSTNANYVFTGISIDHIGDDNFPKLATMGGTYSFQNLASLVKIIKSGSLTLGNGALSGATALKYIDLDKIVFGANLMRNWTSLEVMVLRNTESLSTTPAIPTNSRIATGNAFVYVPNALLNSYKTANNWNAYPNQILAIEGSYYETHYADGKEITT